jgi:PEP-CTERM motif
MTRTVCPCRRARSSLSKTLLRYEPSASACCAGTRACEFTALKGNRRIRARRLLRLNRPLPNLDVRVELLDSADDVLGSATGSGPTQFAFEFVGLISDTVITRVRMTSTGSGLDDDFAIDDSRFSGSVSAVPEAGTLALLGLGLAGVAASRRRKP